MQKSTYQKSFLSYTEQIALLKSRGLSFKDEAKALNIFESVSYYRLSNYWQPFLKDKQNKAFKENADFDDVFKLYKFDAALRRMIMAEVEKIEIAVRSKIAYTLSLSNGSFWLEKNPACIYGFGNNVFWSAVKIIQEFEVKQRETGNCKFFWVAR